MTTAPPAPRTDPSETVLPPGFRDDRPRPDSPWRSVDWPRHLRRIAVDGRDVNLVDIGEGPAVLLIHGLGGCWQNWLENIPALAESRRVVAVDLPGFGESDMPADDVSISGYGRTVESVLEELGIGSASLVGNSMGGFVAAEMAIQYPERAERLVLVAAAALWNEQRRARPLVTVGSLTQAVGARVAAQWELALRRPRLRYGALAGAGIRHPLRLPLDLCYEIMQGAGRDGFVPGLRALYDYRLRDRMPEIECPTLIVWGTHDTLVPVAHATEYERLIPNARKVILPDTGHVPMLERPATFNALVEEFLAEGDAASGGATTSEAASPNGRPTKRRARR